MEKEKKYFLAEDSALDSDSAPFAVSPNSWVNAENIRTRTTDTGVIGGVESIGGMVMISTPLPSVSFQDIGIIDDPERSRILYFKYNLYNPLAHKITCFDNTLNQEFDVLLSSQVEDGLNFNNFFNIHNCRVVDGKLVFTDNYNEPRYVNIDAGIKLNNPSYVTGIKPYVAPVNIHLIKRPPEYRLLVLKSYDSGFANNFIKNSAYQFRYEYVYRDFQASVLSTYAQLVPLNYKSEGNNSVIVTMQFTEKITDYVQQVVVWVKNLTNGSTYVARRFDKNNPTDAAAIIAHNAGSTALTFTFYDNIAPEFLDSVSDVTPYHDVPLLSKTMEAAKNRIFLGNNKLGYNTPSFTSLGSTVINSATGGGSFAAVWGYVTLNANLVGGCQYVYNYPFAYSTTAPHKYYYFPGVRMNTAWNGGTYLPDLTATQNMSNATVVSDTEAAFVSSLKFSVYPYSPSCSVGFPTWQTAYTVQYDYSGTIEPMTLLSYTPGGQAFFKSASTYNISIEFLDRERRKCGIVTPTIKNTIPERIFSQTSFSATIQWTLSNLNALTEIPDWAWYYQILITKNLTTRFFEQVRTKGAAYVKKNQDGTFDYTGTTFTYGSFYAVGIDISNFATFGLGYVFNEGDLARVGKSDDTNYLLSVLGQDGNYVLLQPVDLGTLAQASGGGATVLLLELFTPYKPLSTEFYYETGDVYPVQNPTTALRTYSTLTNSINGDCYAIQRNYDNSTQYITENMSPNDTYWKVWYTDTGWPNIVDTIGQTQRKTSIQFSDTYIQGTKNNNLNVFEPLNQKDLPGECGQLQRLKLTSKVQNQQGFIMLAICEKETASLYLGESQVLSPNGDAFLAASTDVIGTINILKGSYGTVDPESVTEFRGNVYWLDAGNGKYIQYGANGMFPISNYRMTRFWKQFSDLYLSMSKTQIAALGSRPFVFSIADPHNYELLISIPQISAVPTKGYLPDYPNKIYPFDIYDGQAKTIVYKLDMGEGRPYWMGAYTFCADCFGVLQNKVYSAKYGQIFLHNQPGIPNVFYNAQYSSKIMVVSNPLPSKPKMYDNVTTESNFPPSFVYLYNNYPIQQSSDLVDLDFRPIEGSYYTTIKRNKLIPTAVGYTTDGLMTGEKMRNVAMWIMFEWRLTNSPLELKFIDIGYTISKGNPI